MEILCKKNIPFPRNSVHVLVKRAVGILVGILEIYNGGFFWGEINARVKPSRIVFFIASSHDDRYGYKIPKLL